MAAENAGLTNAGAGGSRPPHEHVPLPLERAILWTPRVSAGRAGGAPHAPDAYPLFLEQEVISGLMRHLSAGGKEPRFGFLLGRLYLSPASGVAYAVADTVVEAGEALAEEASGAGLIRAWSEARDAFSMHAGLLLGWYHSHFKLGLMPSDADLDTTTRYFDAPWQFSIIVVPDRARPLGGVFRAPARDAAGSGARPAAFYEILAAPHGGNVGAAESAVAWANYEAHPSGPASTSTPASPPRAPGGPAEVDSTASPPWQAPPAAPVVPAETSRVATDPKEGKVPAAVEEKGSDVAEGAGAAEAGGPGAPDRPEAEPRVGPGASIPGWRQVDRRTHPRLTLWEDEVAPRSVFVEPPAPGRSPTEYRAGVPLVIPGEGGQAGLLPPRSRRIAWPVVIAGVLALGAVLFFLLPGGEPRPPRPLDPAEGAATPTISTEVRQFQATVDSLGLAAVRYAERAADFDAGRIGCNLLLPGYAAADDAYVRVATSFRELGAPSNSRTQAAYERAGEEMAEVNGHFDRTGCPRP